MNFENETKEVGPSSSQPILVMILIIAIAGACFYYFNQSIKDSISSLLSSSDITFEMPPEPKIDFEFLKGEEFGSLESFPEYPSFQATQDIEAVVVVGRENPFLPFPGYSPAVEQVQEVQEPKPAPSESETVQ